LRLIPLDPRGITIVSADESDMTTATPRSAGQQSRKQQAVEVCVFLTLIVPASLLSLFTVSQWHSGFVLTAISVMLRDVSLCSLVLYLVWKNGEPLSSIGWSGRVWPLQIAVGVTIFPAVLIGTYLFALFCLRLGFSSPRTAFRAALAVQELWQLPVGILLCAVVAAVEETIFRGYLLLRLRAATGNLGIAVVLSTVIFTAGHSYEGGAGMAAVTLLGLVFTGLYLSTRSLIPAIVVHFLFDLFGVVVLPLLARHH
jgi:uncharacterized protein